MVQFIPGSQVWQLITLLSIVGEYPLGSRHLLGNKAVFKNLVHKLNRPQTFCNIETAFARWLSPYWIGFHPNAKAIT